MPMEIERRFLVRDTTIVAGRPGMRITQGYLSREPERTVRVRLALLPDGGERGWLTVKGMNLSGTGPALARPEEELEIPPEQARRWLAFCLPALVEKTRHRVTHAGHVWEVDLFCGGNEGLALAEIELAMPDEEIVLPPWLGEEISADPRYANSALSQRPWRAWSDS